MLTPIALVAVLAVMARFLSWVEQRPGVVLADPVLAHVPARDLTWLTFGLVYVGLVTAFVVLLPYPRRSTVTRSTSRRSGSSPRLTRSASMPPHWPERSPSHRPSVGWRARPWSVEAD